MQFFVKYYTFSLGAILGHKIKCHGSGDLTVVSRQSLTTFKTQNYELTVQHSDASAVTSFCKLMLFCYLGDFFGHKIKCDGPGDLTVVLSQLLTTVNTQNYKTKVELFDATAVILFCKVMPFLLKNWTFLFSVYFRP